MFSCFIYINFLSAFGKIVLLWPLKISVKKSQFYCQKLSGNISRISAQEYSEITPIIKTKEDGTLTYLVSGLEYTNAIFVRYGSIVCVHLHGTCPYKLGENIYAKITDPVFIPDREITAVAAFASGTAKNGTGILKIKQDGSVNIIATEEGLNWIFADIFYVV